MAKLSIRSRIPAKGVQSLVWQQNTLVDWVSGCVRIELDGKIHPRSVCYSFPFDAASSSPSGRYAVIYTRLGTKGLVLDQGTIIREINRSFYHAHVYEFPVSIVRHSSGRELLIHCPDEYNQLEIEDIETGERLTSSEPKSPDFFHSRLASSQDGKFFLSAGWIWHPVDSLSVFRIDDALHAPNSLNDSNIFSRHESEISSAAFLDDHSIVISTSNETFVDEEDFTDDQMLRPNTISVWNILHDRFDSQVEVAEVPGTMLPIDSRYVVGFHQHPKLIDIQTGQVISRLEDINSGLQTSSIIHHIDPVPPLAFDSDNRRFAIATESEVLVVDVVTD